MNSYAHHGLLPTNIPLHCNICPKKPDFSDVSHLLTHIASKGHLSHYYKMKVRGSTDPESQQVVAEYDEWYEEWNVQELMRERMSQKERKKGGSNGIAGGSRRTSAANSVASTTARNTPIPAPRPPRRSYALRQSTLDPQLDRIVKEEPRSRSTTPAVPFAMDPAAMSRQYEPPMQMWPGGASPFVDSPMTEDASVFNSFYTTTPSSDFAEETTPKKAKAKGRKPGRNMSGSTQSLEEDGEAELELQTLILKGIVWPGMTMFDAATPDQQRKRNQKKDHSVLAGLQKTSTEIEPMECVFDIQDEGFNVQRERFITGNPNEADGMSPLRGESDPEPESSPKPKKKRAPRKPRDALTTKDTNTTRVTKRRRAESHHPPFGNASRRAPYYDGGDDDDDDQLTYGRTLPPARQGVSIHRDNSGPEITFEEPVSINVLTSSLPNPFNNGPNVPRSQSMIQNGYCRGGQHNRQSSLSMPGNFRPAAYHGPGSNQPRSLASFGQLSGNLSSWNNASFQNIGAGMTMANGQYPNFQNFGGGMTVANGQQTMSPFQQELVPIDFNGMDIGAMPHVPRSHSMNAALHNSMGSFDPFGSIMNPEIGHMTMSGPPVAESSFSMPGDPSSGNPLFFSSTNGAPDEDDQATISPPPSACAGRFREV